MLFFPSLKFKRVVKVNQFLCKNACQEIEPGKSLIERNNVAFFKLSLRLREKIKSSDEVVLILFVKNGI